MLLRKELTGEGPTSILDFGCGIGNCTRALARHIPTASVVGSDRSAESIRRAQQLTSPEERISYAHLGGDSLPWPDGTFDAVFTSNVFHHIDRRNQPAVAAELRRVLRSSGSVFVFEHNPYNPITRRVVAACPFDEGVVLVRPAYLRSVLRVAGLRPAAPRYYSFFPNALARLRPLEKYLRALPIGAQYYVRAQV